jgi:hypothetical protein
VGANPDFRVPAHDVRMVGSAALPATSEGSPGGGDDGGSFPTAPLLVGLLAVAGLTGAAFMLRRRTQPSAG